MDFFKLSKEETDFFVYIGEINREGYASLSTEIAKISEEDRKPNALLCLATFGGDPDGGYRIGRCLQHHYEGKVALYVPSLCKSSGTLTAIAANALVIGNQGELGPLDIQLRKADEMGEHSSGLNIFKAINFLEDRVIDQFRRYLMDVKFGSGVSTRLSADIAAKLVHAVIEPIANQIDPAKIGEHQRAIGIAQQYGELLNEMTKSLKQGALATLIAGYPSHGFVIDRKEATKLFNHIYKPCGTLRSVFEAVLPYCFDFNRLGSNPIVFNFKPETTQEKPNDDEPTSQQESIAPYEQPTDNAGESPDSPRTESPTKRSRKKGVGSSPSSV